MLLEFSCSNHKSIKEPIVFSMLAGTDETNLDKTKHYEKYRVLNSAVIYGANGSGKSNFLSAISFVKRLVSNSINNQPGDWIRQNPHKTAGYEQDSIYRIQFVTNDVRYVFGFTLNNKLITEEYLYYFPNNKQTKIFERKGIDFHTGRSFRNKLTKCKDVLKPNRLLLSCAANFSSVPEIEDAFRFFKEDLVIYDNNLSDNWLRYSLIQLKQNPQTKKLFLQLMQDLGLRLKDVQVEIGAAKLEETDIPPILSEEIKDQLMQETIPSFSASVQYEQFDTDLFLEESGGVRKLFSFLCPMIDIIIHGKVLVCDELESGLHEAIVSGLLNVFLNADQKHFAQLILATHDTSILDLKLFRRDQIWFTELRSSDRSTDLYALAEFKGVRKDENIARGYINGKYGAIPMLNVDFARIISST